MPLKCLMDKVHCPCTCTVQCTMHVTAFIMKEGGVISA